MISDPFLWYIMMIYSEIVFQTRDFLGLIVHIVVF